MIQLYSEIAVKIMGSDIDTAIAVNQKFQYDDTSSLLLSFLFHYPFSGLCHVNSYVVTTVKQNGYTHFRLPQMQHTDY